MSDSEDSTVTYTEISSPYEDLSDVGSPGAEGPIFQDPPSPDYVPGPEEPEQAPPSPILILQFDYVLMKCLQESCLWVLFYYLNSFFLRLTQSSSNGDVFSNEGVSSKVTFNDSSTFLVCLVVDFICVYYPLDLWSDEERKIVRYPN
ncbi:hypothetical protein Tco_0567928 [Tanacetum coccineum]